MESDNTGASLMVVQTDEGFVFNTSEGNVISNGISTLVKVSPSGELLWAKPIDFNIQDMRCNQNNNELIIVGTFSGVIDLDPGSEIYLTEDEKGLEYSFITKLDSDGNAIWIKTLSALVAISMKNLLLDNDQNILVCIACYGTCDVDPNEGVVEIEVPLEWSGAMALVRYDSEGEFIDEYHVTMDLFSISNTQLQINEDGKILVSANVFGDIDLNPNLDGGELETNPDYVFNAFILQLNSNLSYDWHHHLYGSEFEPISIESINSNWYLTLFFSGDLDIEFGPNETILTGEGNLLYSIDSSGQEISHVLFDTILETITTKRINDYLVVMGWLFGSIDLDPSPDSETFSTLAGGADGIAIFLDENLQYLAHEEMVGLSFEQIEEMEYTGTGQVYASGLYSSNDFQAQEGGIVHEEAPLSNAFLVQYDLITNLSEFDRQTLNLFPNPAKNNLSILNPFGRQVNCAVYSSDGKLIDTILLNSNLNEINVDTFGAGLYFLHLPEFAESATFLVVD
jgi:hypothetical protein